MRLAAVVMCLGALSGFPQSQVAFAGGDQVEYEILRITRMAKPGWVVSVSLEWIASVEELEKLVCDLVRDERFRVAEEDGLLPSLHVLFFWDIRKDQIGEDGRVLPQLVRNHYFATYTRRAWEPGPGRIRYRGRFRFGRSPEKTFDHLEECPELSQPF